MVDSSPDTPPPVALRTGELLRQRGLPCDQERDESAEDGPPPRESGVFPTSARAAAILAEAAVPPEEDGIPVSEPPMSLAPSNLARVLEALRART
jgi:hypothetical protein